MRKRSLQCAGTGQGSVGPGRALAVGAAPVGGGLAGPPWPNHLLVPRVAMPLGMGPQLKVHDIQASNVARRQCSSLKCAHGFQCEGLQNNHTSVKLSKFSATLHQFIFFGIGRFVLNM